MAAKKLKPINKWPIASCRNMNAVRPVSLDLKNTLRWIAVLPAAIGAYLGIQVVVAIGNSFSGYSESLINMWCQLINSIAGPYCFVLAGAKTAPVYRFITAVVLTTLFSLANGVLLTLVLTSQRQFSTPLWWFVTSLIIGLVAAIGACVQLHHE